MINPTTLQKKLRSALKTDLAVSMVRALDIGYFLTGHQCMISREVENAHTAKHITELNAFFAQRNGNFVKSSAIKWHICAAERHPFS